jgi:hypothetical protein
VVKAARVPFRYSESGAGDYGSLPNLARKFMMFDGPISAGLIWATLWVCGRSSTAP